MTRPLLVAALFAVGAATAPAQATPTVPPNDPVYEFVDRLVAAGLVDALIVGQRPMSRREIGRILHEAQGKLPAQSGDSSWMARSLTRYTKVYSSDAPRAVATERYGAELLMAESPTRGIPSDGNGSVDVDVNPLFANRLGRPSVDGATASGFAGMDGPLSSWLVAAVSGRISALRLFGEKGSESSDAAFDQAYARGVFRNVAISVGRDYLFLGQGMKAGLTNSVNSRGLDMLRLSSEHPFVLPSVLRHIGPIHGTTYLADLGPRQNFPHSRLFGYKVSARPVRSVEIGATVADQVGGRGAPGGTFLQKAGDAFPLIDALFLHRNFQFSNKFVGMDARLTVPRARGLQLYMEGAFDDFDIRRVRSVFTEDAGYVWGASLDCPRECGTARVTAEYHATGVRYYAHSAFVSGYTLDRQFIGNQLGPRGKAAYVMFDVDRVGHRLSIETAHEIRSGDKYRSVTTTQNDSDFAFEIYERNPAERRWRSVVAATRGHPSDVITTRVSAGIERVENFSFRARDWRTNWILQTGVEIRPRTPIFR